MYTLIIDQNTYACQLGETAHKRLKPKKSLSEVSVKSGQDQPNLSTLDFAQTILTFHIANPTRLFRNRV